MQGTGVGRGLRGTERDWVSTFCSFSLGRCGIVTVGRSSEEWNHSRFCLVSWPSSSRNVRTFYERAMYLSQGRRNHGNTHPYQRERHLEFRVLNPRVTGWGLSIRNWHAFLLQVNYFLSTTVQPLFFCRVKHECVFLEKHTFRAGDKKKLYIWHNNNKIKY